MIQIGVTGGKGGTGKSTFSVLLANKFRQAGKKVVLADCDVECPNDYLLLGRKLKSPVKRVKARFPALNPEKCRQCGLCVKNCRSNAIFQAPGQQPVFLHELCSGCGLCWHLCPNQAIRIERKVIGEIFINRIDRNFDLLTGRSGEMVDETGPIVTALKEEALKLAVQKQADYLLFDTAVGMHCGVIRALAGVDFSYAVTEPTPLGAHDLELILKLLKILKVPAEIVLNQADLGKKKLITKISRKTGTKIKYEIPYSPKLVSAYSKGELGKVKIL